MNAKNFVKQWVILEEAGVVGPGGSRFQIKKGQGGRYRFVPNAGCALPAADLEPSAGKGEFEFGRKLSGGLRGSFGRAGALLFTLNKLGTKRYVISVTVLAGPQGKARPKSHGGPHGVDH